MAAISNLTGDILLEAGTNEFEVLTFRLGRYHYGVNVAKVREVIQRQPTRDVPGKHDSVVGLFQLRDNTLTLIDLGKHLNMTVGIGDQPDKGSVIVTEFNNLRVGFLVDAVDRIHRMSWQRMLPVPKVDFQNSDGNGKVTSSVTGAIDLDGTLVLMIDFESVADSILTEAKLVAHAVDNPDNVDRASKRVVMVEDSPFMRAQIKEVMVSSGYTNIQVFSDGQAAWDALKTRGGPKIDAIVSDIEMPRMDGLALTKQIKATPHLKDVPVVLFSSLISADNANKGQQVGASVQIPKPELPEVVRLVDRIVTGKVVDQSQVKEVVITNAA